jgi:2-dehydro-3-deoxyphosphooctonate aldolase (KDO 8-P synthase)
MRLAGFDVGSSMPLFLIAGPCVIESEALVMETAERLKAITAALGVPLVFKASFDKANRSSGTGFRGLGLEQGLKILERVKTELELPVLTDVHERTPLAEVAAVVDVLQTPALLCRQTDFITAVASQGRAVNLKKGQFLSPWEMGNVVEKARAAGNDTLLVCERGASFGYNNLVVDMRALAILRETGCPVVFDMTHAVQLPGALGVAGVFMETHPDPERALCDGPNAWPLDRVERLLTELMAIDTVVKSRPFLETEFRSVH